jgi:hypothetical protein
MCINVVIIHIYTHTQTLYTQSKRDGKRQTGIYKINRIVKKNCKQCLKTHFNNYLLFIGSKPKFLLLMKQKLKITYVNMHTVYLRYSAPKN